MRIRRLVVLSAIVAVAASCANPRTEANVAQALNDAANEIGGLRSDVLQLQSDLDSLRRVVAKQDTLLGRLAEINHVPR